MYPKHNYSLKNKLNHNASKLISLEFIYQEIAKRMFTRMDYIKINPKMILDLGSGINIDSNLLNKNFPNANVINIDIALNVLKHYRPQTNFFKKILKTPSINICANATTLPLISQSIDLVWSNLMLPYITNIDALFSEIHRILKLQGMLLISGLGVDSLIQLRQIGFRTYNFPDMHIIGDILVKHEFSNPVTDIEYITLEYDNFNQLLQDIRVAGCGFSIDMPNTLTKSQYLSLQNNFLSMTKNGKTPLTLEIFYAHAWKDKIKTHIDDQTNIIQFMPRK